jgi:hypothetical protein
MARIVRRDFFPTARRDEAHAALDGLAAFAAGDSTVRTR